MDTDDDIFLIHKRVLSHIDKIGTLQKKTIEKQRSLVLKLLNSKPPHGYTIKEWEHLAKKHRLKIPNEPTTTLNFEQCQCIITELEEIKEIKNLDINSVLYQTNATAILEDYKQCINNVIMTDFMSNTNKRNPMISDEQVKYRNQLVKIVEAVFGTEALEQIIVKKAVQKKSSNSSSCSVVDQGKEDIVDDQDDEWTGMVYNDTTRLNNNQKFKYDKRQHFKETITQYQGLQHTTIPNEVYQAVIKMIELHGLADMTKSNPRERYVRVTKRHIKMFLNESCTEDNKTTDYYEDSLLIWSKITSNPCPNIKNLEKGLYSDFEQLIEVFLTFSEDVVDRKNFLNTHYVLRQLLRKRGVEVPDDDLNHLKTPARQRRHDDIYQMCCDKLGWNFKPLY